MSSRYVFASAVLAVISATNFAFAQQQPPQAASLQALLAGEWQWNVSKPLISAAKRSGDPCYSVKDPTIVRHDNRWHLFSTIRSEKRLRQIEYRSFENWAEADRAEAHVLKLSEKDFCAPQVFYFTPHKKWVLVYQLVDNSRRPNIVPVYSTSTNLADPASWSAPVELFAKTPANVKEWIDFWVICDDAKAHLFFTSLDGHMWRSETKLADFPELWSKPEVVLRGDIFEASHTYKVKGEEKYLTIIESLDGEDSATCRRYYKAYTADRLDGAWHPLAATKERPFAAPGNIKFGENRWTDSISHGELLRSSNDERLEIDPANLKFLFQGVSDEARRGKKYGEIPWQLGLLEPAGKVVADKTTDSKETATVVQNPPPRPTTFLRPDDVVCRVQSRPGERRLAYARHTGEFEAWRKECKAKFAELLGVTEPAPCMVKILRATQSQGTPIQVLAMKIGPDFTIPAYILYPKTRKFPKTAVIAIHGHGEIDPCIGQRDEYHHQFALKLAEAGHVVLCPEIRGFGVLKDMSIGREGYRLDYWNDAKRVNDRQFTMVTDTFQHGETLIGETIEDLLRWEDYLVKGHEMQKIHVVGLSYGGDLAMMYPVFSKHVDRIFVSGSFGSFSPIFARCYNAPAHCIPGVLRWMDRSDIAALNAPRPIAFHYGERDTPSKDNYSAAYNETVEPALQELKKAYSALSAEEKVSLIVSPGKGHEMDIEKLVEFLK